MEEDNHNNAKPTDEGPLMIPIGYPFVKNYNPEQVRLNKAIIGQVPT